MQTVTNDASFLVRRLADYAVLINDPSVPAASATFWELSEAAYGSVRSALDQLASIDPPRVGRAYQALTERPNSVEAFRELQRAISDLLDGKTGTPAFPGEKREELSRLISEADQQIWIDHHIGDRFTPGAPDTPPTELAELLRHRYSPRSPSGPVDVQIVIPFRDREGSGRLRNLLACLSAVRDQELGGLRYAVTVVESDDQPRWRSVIEPLVEHYLFLPKTGLFNKSWAVNVGVVNAPFRADLVSVLDADVLVDRSFIRRNAARFAGGSEAHLTYQWMSCLDADSSCTAVRVRCLDGDADVSLTDLRALVLREPPGACLWSTVKAFHTVGGFDERFEGWGGEDNDVVDRLVAAVPFTRFSDPLLHLDHPRPTMRVDGKALNTYTGVPTWTPGHGFGRLSAPGGTGTPATADR